MPGCPPFTERKKKPLDKQLIVTEEGLKKLEDELEQLKTVRRQDVAEKIKVARSFGDLSENSEYDEAKNEQAMMEARIAQLEQRLKNVRVLDEDDIGTDHVNVGSVVKCTCDAYEGEDNFTIVGSTEADPLSGKISDESPVGKALMGHQQGDTVEVELPSGQLVHYTIVKIGK